MTTFEEFAKAGIYLRKADLDRVNGGRAVRRALHFKRSVDGQLVQRPRIVFVDTPGNRRVFDQLSEIMPDENNVNKPAKVDADSEGRGGDDGADMFRYGVASHPPLAQQPLPTHIDKDKHPGWQIQGNKAERKVIPHAVDQLERGSHRLVPSYRRPR